MSSKQHYYNILLHRLIIVKGKGNVWLLLNDIDDVVTVFVVSDITL